MMVRKLSFLSTLLNASLVTTAYLLARLFWPAAIFSLLVVIWAIAFFRDWKWIHSAGLFLAFGFVAAGFFLGLNAGLLFPGAFLALAGWDLADFAYRMELVGTKAEATNLQNHHLVHLGWVLAVGIVLVLVVLNLQLSIPFEWTVVLALLAVGGLGTLVNRLLRGN